MRKVAGHVQGSGENCWRGAVKLKRKGLGTGQALRPMLYDLDDKEEWLVL